MEQNFYSLCRNVEVRVETLFQRELADLDLTPAQANLLLVILESYPNGTTITELHSSMGVTKSSLSSLIKSLRQKGYLCTTNHETDDRVKVLQPTDKLFKTSKKLQSAEERLIANMRQTVGEKEFSRTCRTLRELACKGAQSNGQGVETK